MWFGLWLWISIVDNHRLSELTVWTDHPLVLPCHCQHVGTWRRTQAGYRGVGHLDFFFVASCSNLRRNTLMYPVMEKITLLFIYFHFMVRPKYFSPVQYLRI